jgi:hypothetical protein
MQIKAERMVLRVPHQPEEQCHDTTQSDCKKSVV